VPLRLRPPAVALLALASTSCSHDWDRFEPRDRAGRVDHVVVNVTTQQTTASTEYVDVPGAEIPAAFFTPGTKYLLRVTGQVANTEGAYRSYARLVHGDEPFDAVYHQHSLGTERWSSFEFLTVWQAVGGEGVGAQFRAQSPHVARIDQLVMAAISLEDGLVEGTDWFFHDRYPSTALGPTPSDGAMVTVDVAGTWLVFANVNIHAPHVMDVSGPSFASRLISSEEAIDSPPEWRASWWGGGGSLTVNTGVSLVVSTTGPRTFIEQSEADAAGPTRNRSTVFALNLERFRHFAHAFADTRVELPATDFGQEILSIDVEPDVRGDVLAGAFWAFDSAGRQASYRLQVDGEDDPETQTSDAYLLSCGKGAFQAPMVASALAELAAERHEIRLDAGATDTGTAALHRSLWAFTLDLAP
jgi:hypothetical protein